VGLAVLLHSGPGASLAQKNIREIFFISLVMKPISGVIKPISGEGNPSQENLKKSQERGNASPVC
jgi:hypothetical protein